MNCIRISRRKPNWSLRRQSSAPRKELSIEAKALFALVILTLYHDIMLLYPCIAGECAMLPSSHYIMIIHRRIIVLHHDVMPLYGRRMTVVRRTLSYGGPWHHGSPKVLRVMILGGWLPCSSCTLIRYSASDSSSAICSFSSSGTSVKYLFVSMWRQSSQSQHWYQSHSWWGYCSEHSRRRVVNRPRNEYPEFTGHASQRYRSHSLSFSSSPSAAHASLHDSKFPSTVRRSSEDVGPRTWVSNNRRKKRSPAEGPINTSLPMHVCDLSQCFQQYCCLSHIKCSGISA